MHNVVQFQVSANKKSSSERNPVCVYLTDAGKLKSEHVDRALRLQKEQTEWERIGSILVKLGLVSERDVVESIASQLSLRLVERNELPEQLLFGKQISPRFLRASKAIIFDEDEGSLWVAMADPQQEDVLKALRLISGKEVLLHICVPSEIEAALDQIYDAGKETRELDLSVGFAEDVEHLKELAGEAPVIKLVNQLIQNAAESGASDIHIEPFEDQMKVRYRVDGLLREVDAPPAQSAAAVISRIKIMANMDIAERRLAQDGRFKQRIRGMEFDFRISTVPTIYGESVVLRLLKRDEVVLGFGPLGFSPEQTETMHNILAQPHGIVLVTGPTGSGKSTTLYAALKHLNDPERMIITVEDPVEYHMHGINQIQVKPQIGLTFANALRSIVRQDPDVIMIGEMRDAETAQIAVQAALTGHLVLSTLHTNDAAGSVMRLIDMGIPDYLLVSAVKAIQAQRLVRRLCTECRQAYQPVEEVSRWGLDRFAEPASMTLYHAVGCKACGGTGYNKRTAILEILPISDSIRQQILQQSDTGKIAAVAAEQGMLTMRDDGFSKVVTGQTTIEEVLRVTPDPV
jgi:general secretion pathway protein E